MRKERWQAGPIQGGENTVVQVRQRIVTAADTTQDVDIVADLQLAHVRSFVKLLDQDYYIVEDAVRDAIRRRSSFNLISNETFMKVDVFIPKSRAFDQDAVRGLKRQPLVKGGREFALASPENIVVNKLEWYEIGDGY